MHETFWNGHDDDFDLEDNRLHDFYMRWDPMENSLTIILDGDIVYYGVKDLVNEVFNGENEVIWGFTASTGRAFNQQYFCLKRLASIK